MTLVASMVFAEDEVMKRAQGMFKPIPETTPPMKDKSFRLQKWSWAKCSILIRGFLQAPS
jgi:hypothetical protein